MKVSPTHNNCFLLKHAENCFLLKQAGDTNHVYFEPVPCRTGFVNLEPKSLYQIILVIFCLVLTSIINHLIYFLKPVLLHLSGCPKPSNLRQTGT